MTSNTTADPSTVSTDTKGSRPRTMEESMKKAYATLAALLVLALVPVGCSMQRDDDEQAITDLLNSSGYTDESNDRSYGSEDTTLSDGSGGPGADDPRRPPFVRFRRCIPQGGVSRTINIQIPAYPGYPDSTALATVSTDINGELRTMFDTTGNPILVWRKKFQDQAVRRVYLTRTRDGWRIRKVTPLEFRTVDAPYELRIRELKVHAASWRSQDTFRIHSGDTMLAKHDLPRFVPADTVTVWVEIESSGDSCWTFLHHGRPKWPHRWRRAYARTATHRFRGTWLVGDEQGQYPQVRPSGHDAIGWKSLWADTTEPYVSAAWGLPYIVAEPNQELPEE